MIISRAKRVNLESLQEFSKLIFSLSCNKRPDYMHRVQGETQISLTYLILFISLCTLVIICILIKLSMFNHINI